MIASKTGWPCLHCGHTISSNNGAIAKPAVVPTNESVQASLPPLPVAGITEVSPPIATINPPLPQAVSMVGLSGTDMSASEDRVTRKKRIRRVLIGIVVILVILGSGYVFRLQLLAVLPGKFTTYNYPTFKQQSFKFSVGYYKGSKIEEWAPPAPPGDPLETSTSSLISPIQKGTSTMILNIRVGVDNSDNVAVANKLNTCNLGDESQSFTVLIPSLRQTANMCEVGGQINGDTGTIAYTSGVISPITNSVLLIIVTSNYHFVSTPEGAAVSGGLDLGSYQNDIQHIISSIKYTK
jgi:hypothetical protein